MTKDAELAVQDDFRAPARGADGERDDSTSPETRERAEPASGGPFVVPDLHHTYLPVDVPLTDTDDIKGGGSKSW
jgi:hypothetical protein